MSSPDTNTAGFMKPGAICSILVGGLLAASLAGCASEISSTSATPATAESAVRAKKAMRMTTSDEVVPGVNRGRDRLFGIGGCASAAYVPLVAVTDKRLKAIATISGRSNNMSNYFELMPKEEFIRQVTAANEARQRMYETGEVETSDVLGVYQNADRDDFPEGLSREGYDYYMTDRGRTENFNSVAEATVMEYVPLLDAATFAPYFYMPYIGVVGENAQTAFTTERLYERAEEPKELVVIKDATHVSLYDVPEQVEEAVERIDAFWTANVK